MEKIESIEDLAKKYREIFLHEHDRISNGPTDCYMTNFLIEFAGAVAHHLSSERAVEAEAESRCPLYVDYKKSCTDWQHRKKELNRSA